MKDLLTLKQAGRYLAMHPEVLRRKAAAGDIPAAKLGKGKRSPWRFDRAELDRWMAHDAEPDAQSEATDRSVRKMIDLLASSDDLDKLAAAIHGLGLLGAEDAVPHLSRFIDSPFEELRFLACRSLIWIMGPESRSRVYHLLETDPSPRIQLTVAGCFARENDSASLDWLRNTIRTASDPQIRRLAAYQLLEHDPEKTLPLLRDDLHAPKAPLRYRALMALAAVTYPGLESDLLTMLSDKFPAIRKKAVEYLGNTGNREHIPVLQKILAADEPDDVKRAAALAMARLYGNGAP